ncbi:MAG TPA: BON domain-containing protein [Woeseiaceae bacterium]
MRYPGAGTDGRAAHDLHNRRPAVEWHSRIVPVDDTRTMKRLQAMDSGERGMRVTLVLALVLALSGCTGMLLGSGSSSSGSSSGGGATSSPAQLASDSAITAAARNRLIGDGTVGRYDLRVQTVNRRVTLYGTVDSYSARDQAVQLTRAVDGVSSVDNQIRVDTRRDTY